MLQGLSNPHSRLERPFEGAELNQAHIPDGTFIQKARLEIILQHFISIPWHPGISINALWC